MKTAAAALALVAVSMIPAPASAQQVTLQISNGLVSLDAQNVSVRQILAEWSRVGGARIVNAEKVAGSLVTLQLNGIPERQALDTILRGVSGYMLAARPAGGAGVSAFDRILILPTSAAPRGAPMNAGLSGPRPAPVVPEPAETEIVEDGDNDQPEPENEGGEEEVAPQQTVNPRSMRRPGFPTPMGNQPQPYPQPGMNPQGDGQMAQPPSVGNPFGVPIGAGSATPGVVTPVPQQDPQQQPPQPTRPPRPPL